MGDEMTGGGEAAGAGAVEAQGAATEAGTQQTQSSGTPQEWRVGDTTFKTPGELHQGALRWQGDFTRVSQEKAALMKEMGGFKAVFNIVTQDPRLREEVMRRMQSGQTQQQAVQQTAQNHPEMLQRFQQYDQRVGGLERKLLEMDQDRAQYEFKEKHADITEAEWTAMAQFIGTNHEWFGPSVTPSQMIELAYHNAVLPQRLQSMQTAQAQQTQEDPSKRSKPLLGSQAASASARAPSNERPKGKLSPQQEREWAQKVYSRNKGAR